VQQVLPLPEPEQYIVQLKQMEQSAPSGSVQRSYLAFWSEVRDVIKALPRWAGRAPANTGWLGVPSGVRGLRYDLWVRQNDAGGHVCIGVGSGKKAWNKAVYDALHAKRAEIQAVFGEPLHWLRLDAIQASFVSFTAATDGYKSPHERWPEIARKLVEKMRRFEAAIEPHLKVATDAAAGAV
jgi:hypothetical protein